jgi:nicotinate-nucleotide pyrophosphorylase (carboxylating)
MTRDKNFQHHLHELILNALKEDIGDGDHSTLSIIGPEVKGKAILKIKENGILAGVAIAKEIFFYVEPGSVFTKFKEDGDSMQ